MAADEAGSAEHRDAPGHLPSSLAFTRLGIDALTISTVIIK
jgi:hypothetical protein